MHPDLIETPQAAETAPLYFRTLSNQGEVQPVLVDETVPEPVQEDVETRVEGAREEGRREAAMLLQQEMENRVRMERESVAAALESFVTEKRRYFAGLEKEVVRLSLAIAERVLHRESSMDPTLLAAAARVALEQVDHESEAVLRVSPADMGDWQRSVARIGREVTLREDASLQRGECVLETEAGSFELGVRAQLCEIERGFFELMGRTPAVTA